MEHELERNGTKQQDRPEIPGAEAGNSRLEDKTERDAQRGAAHAGQAPK